MHLQCTCTCSAHTIIHIYACIILFGHVVRTSFKLLGQLIWLFVQRMARGRLVISSSAIHMICIVFFPLQGTLYLLAAVLLPFCHPVPPCPPSLSHTPLHQTHRVRWPGPPHVCHLLWQVFYIHPRDVYRGGAHWDPPPPGWVSPQN